jgi:hypothetical protein
MRLWFAPRAHEVPRPRLEHREPALREATPSRAGVSVRVIAAGLALLMAMAPAVRADAPPAVPEGGAPYEQGERIPIRPAPSTGQKIYDAAVLRPFGSVQAVVSAAVFVVLYPVALVTGTRDELTEMCITGPVEQTFKRPLGEP